MRLPAKATHAQTREHNHRLVLRTVYDFGPISRAEVARSTGLTRTTVSDVVADLL
jgi:DNA-binding MarR family transcriptional regulator